MTTYSHRDGASRIHYNHNETLLSSLTIQEQNEIQHLRKFLKINNYLRNIPQETISPELFPFKTDEKITPEELVEKAIDLKFFDFFEINSVSVIEEKEIKNSNKNNNKSKEEKPKNYIPENFIKFIPKGNEYKGFNFKITAYQFNKLLIYCIQNKGTIEEVNQVDEEGFGVVNSISIGDKLVKFIVNKKEFITWLNYLNNHNSKINKEDEAKLRTDMNQFSYFWKGADKKILPKIDNFLAQYCNNFSGKRGSWQETRKSLVRTIIEQDIELRFSDILLETDGILRNENKFMYLSIQYLMDFPISDNWFWQIESQEIDIVGNSTQGEIKMGRKIEYSKKLKTKYHISLDQNQQAVLIYAENIEGDTFSKTEAKKYQKFLIGHKSLKNILIANKDGKITKDNDILKLLNIDIKHIIDGDMSKATYLHHLDKNNRPKYVGNLLKEMGNAPTKSLDIKSKALKRIELLIGTETKSKGEFIEILSKIEEKKNPLKRKDKNEQILRIYNFFDWKYPDGTLKFLRKDEYKKMSIYHYSMEKNRLEYLIEDIKERMPVEVIELIESSHNIDDLLKKSIEKAIDLLEEYKKAILNDDYFRHSQDKIFRMLHVSKSNLSKEQKKDNLSFLPFDIHPELIVNIYYDEENSKAKKDSSNSKGYGYSLSNKYRLKALEDKELILKYYESNAFFDFISNPDGLSKPLQIAQRKCIGKLNEIFIQDILLWDMAKEYYSNCNRNATTPMKYENNQIKIKNFSSVLLSIPLDYSLTVTLLFHQLDDFLLSDNKKDMIAIIHSHNKRIEYDKTKITLKDLKEEKRKIYHESLQFLKDVMEWEKKLIEKKEREYIHNIGFKKLQYGSIKNLEHIKFDTICKFVLSKEEIYLWNLINRIFKLNKENGDKDKIKKLEDELNEKDINKKFQNGRYAILRKLLDTRNNALHSNIPIEWTYNERINDNDINKVIFYYFKNSFLNYKKTNNINNNRSK